MSKSERLTLFAALRKKLAPYSNEEIEISIAKYYLNSINKKYSKIEYLYLEDIINILNSFNFPADLEYIVDFFEFLLEDSTKSKNGIVFTPKYIADYIFSSLLEKNPWTPSKKIIDPGCGVGIFLISAIEILCTKYGADIDFLIKNCIYGIDIEPENIRRCSIILMLLSAKFNGNMNNVKYNLLCKDSLKINWSKEFSVDEFSYVIGNPPYVNPHDLSSQTANFLKKTFSTTKSGVFNIFYAFIEHGIRNLADTGNLGFIIPNNFLTIKSAEKLRNFLRDNKFIYKIVDFSNNMVFKPTRTYNCIVFLNKLENKTLKYHITDRTSNIELYLKNISFNSIETAKLDSHGWKLVESNVRSNILKIEGNEISIKPYIRTGIATLKDSVFMVESDKSGYFKKIDGKKHYIEKDIIKPIYKIPDLKHFNNIKEAERYIIFPYEKTSKGYNLINEEDFIKHYPLSYNVLSHFRETLDSRDKGKPNSKGWYAYGRSQGLNKYGKKILFPTFSNKPNFVYVNNEDALFCNGYAIFENNEYDLNILTKIMNSSVMNYYVKNTSYSIEGGYFCYQKKYIDRFSLPKLSVNQISKIHELSGKELDSYLWDLYKLK